MNSRLPSAIRPVPEYLPTHHVHNSGYHEEQHHEVELREYFKVVYKYRLIIAATAAVASLLALVFAFTATPLYVTASKVRIGTYEPVLTATKIEDMLQEKSKETNYIETQLEEMKSFSLADRVLEDPEINKALFSKGAQGFFGKMFGGVDLSNEKPGPMASGYKSSLAQIKKYLSMIEVKPVRRTSLVSLEVTSSDPILAAMLANRHAQSYIDWVRDVRVDQQSRGLKFLKQQAEELREKVADLERESADYAEANSIVALNKDENITVQKMSQLNQLLTQAMAHRIEAENLWKESETALSSPSAGFDDPSTQQMRSELSKLEGEYGQLSTKFTDNYPRMKELKSQIEEVRKSISGQRRQIVLGLKAKAMAAAEEEKNLKEELEQQKSQAFELSKRQVQYNVLNRELTSSRELLQNVIRQIKETSLAVESNASNVSIVDLAVVPPFPSFPRKKIFLGVGLFLGALVGVGIAFLLNYLDNTVRTPEQLSALIQVPSLGVVPSFALEKLMGVDLPADPLDGGKRWAEGAENLVPVPSANNMPVAYLKDPRSLAAEAYRTIRTALLLSQAGEAPRTILVSSAQSAEGKTTSSINLAACLASAGGRVVLVDADLRRPSVGRHLGIDSHTAGLVEVLTGQMTISQVAIPEKITGVTVIPSGTIPPNPAELLGSLDMARIIDELTASFDYVIIDSPPVLPVTDSVILSRYVDGVVMVVRGAATPKKVIRDAKSRLQAVGARFLGTILNDVDVTSGDYYYYNRYYYAYYQTDGKKPGAKVAS